LEVTGDGADRRIKVESHLYKFQSNPEGFYPLRAADGSEVFRHSIPFAKEVVPALVAASVAASTEEMATGAVAAGAGILSAPTDAEASMGDKRTRHIVDRFWDLDASDRREIALELGLIDQEEVQLPEAQRYGVALIRAAERHLIDRLAELVTERE
jgi:hypothetical protein